MKKVPSFDHYAFLNIGVDKLHMNLENMKINMEDTILL